MSSAELRRRDNAALDTARALPLEAGLLDCAVALKRIGRELVGPCPRCGGSDRFSINPAKSLWNCRGCGGRGNDALSLAMHIAGCGFREAVERLTGEPSKVALMPRPYARRIQSSGERASRSEAALTVWANAKDPRGSLVERYLAGRGLELQGDIAGNVIRFHSACPWRDDNGALIGVPCMVALYRDIRSDRPVAIHRTALTTAGGKLFGRGSRRAWGPAAGAAVKLDADDAVSMGLVLGEGIESCLAARQMGLRPVWALGGAGQVATFPLLPGVEGLTLLEEDDDASRKAVEACAARWRAAGCDVLFAKSLFGKDANDAIMEVQRCATT
jgi:hypothetical protein